MSMSEAELLENVRDAARTFRWLTYHTHSSRRSEPGFPDLVLVRGGRILYRELKRDSKPSRVTGPQRQWLEALTAAGQDAAIWTPADWPDEIVRQLR